MMKDYYQQSMRALQLAGMSEPTQKGYTRSVRMLVDFYGKTPDLISEQELQDYFLHRKTSINGQPLPCASATAASSSFLSTCSNAIGTPWSSSMLKE
jgi:hypothetical protein